MGDLCDGWQLGGTGVSKEGCEIVDARVRLWAGDVGTGILGW
jgi:hypothetical protein